ncbi:MAG: hypothetical protein U0169_13745 [Polyangiaceae bacterium]
MPKPSRTTPRELTLTIASVARGGEGVAHAVVDGRPRAVFVPHTVPGDVVVATVDASSSPARGALVRVEKRALRASLRRVPCSRRAAGATPCT